MDGYTVISNEADFNVAKGKNMKIFKQGLDGLPEEVINNNDTFGEGLYYTKNEGGTPSVPSSNGVPVAAPSITDAAPPTTTTTDATQPTTTDTATASSTSDLLKSLAEDPHAMTQIQNIVRHAGESKGGERKADGLTAPAAGGRRRSTRRRHKKSSKKSRRQSKKGGKKHKKPTKKGKKRSQRKH